MGTWAVVALLVALAVTVGVLAWLAHLAAKLRAYVLQAGDATRLLQAASQRALAEFPPEPAQGDHRADPHDMPAISAEERALEPRTTWGRGGTDETQE